jgi:hypothetical protein
MKRWSIIIAAALIAVWLIVDTPRDFFASETIQYFSSEPHRLLYVAALAIAGGLAAFAFDRLSRQAQRRVHLFAWGAAASILTLCVGYMVFRLASLFWLVVESGGMLGVLLVLLILTAIAAYLWFEFYRAWQK